jgi:hypothetical protein
MRPQYLPKALPVHRRTMRSTDIVFRPVVPKTEPLLLVPEKEPRLLVQKKEKDATLPQGLLYLRRPGPHCVLPPPPPKENEKFSAYIRHQAALRAPDDPEDSLGFAKAMAESKKSKYLRRPATDDEYGEWWSATESGIFVDMGEVTRGHGDAARRVAASIRPSDQDNGANGADDDADGYF